MKIGLWLGIVLVLTGMMGAPAMAELRIALVIGNADYSLEVGALPNPVNDARLIAKTLRQVGFDVMAVENADHAQLKRAIEALSAQVDKAGADVTALVYYAGKGVQIQGRAYLLPIEASWKGPLAIEQQGITADAAVTAMSKAKVRIFIFDASRRLPPESGAADAPVPTPSELDPGQGAIIAFSTSPGSVAMDGSGANGPYALALSRAMLMPGLDSLELFRQVRIDVMSATGERQVPWDSSSLIEPFILFPEK